MKPLFTIELTLAGREARDRLVRAAGSFLEWFGELCAVAVGVGCALMVWGCGVWTYWTLWHQPGDWPDGKPWCAFWW